MLGGFPVTTTWWVLGSRMEDRSQAMEGSCEYIEKAVEEKRQGVILQRGGWAWG
jgi:hypothetical protein